MTATLPSYDEIPYESFAITETHPDRLAVIGRLFALQCPAPSDARVLELGCAAGGNLLPIAYYLPHTRCLGVELSEAQARRGRELARAIDLDNLQIRHQDIRELPLQGEPFDYIIAHGVYSWVPTAVQEHILALCGARLAPGGIAYISYNTLPGSRQRSMLRDMLLHHVHGITRPRERLAGARDLLAFLSTPLEESPPGHDWLRRELEHLRGARDSYLYHEYLEATNEPELFTDFVTRARRHGLQYLADSQLHTLFGSTLGDAAESRLSRFDDLVAEEQYGDFLRLRGFRQSLLCRADQALTREIDLDRFLALPLYTDLSPREDGGFRNDAGRSFEIGPPLLRAVVRSIGALFPRASRLAEILPPIQERMAREGQPVTGADVAALPGELFSLFVSGGLQATLCAPDCGRGIGPASGQHWAAAPIACRLAQQGEHLIPTPRHQTLRLDPLSVRTLALLDGGRDLTAVVEALIGAAARDPSLARALGSERPEHQRAVLRGHIEGLFRLLQRHGLLEPAVAAPPLS